MSYFEYTPLRVESGTHGKSGLKNCVITSWILGAVRMDAPLIGDCDGKKVQVQVLGAGGENFKALLKY